MGCYTICDVKAGLVITNMGNGLFTWLSLMMSSVVTNFVLSLFPHGILGGIWDLIVSVPENFFLYTFLTNEPSLRNKHICRKAFQKKQSTLSTKHATRLEVQLHLDAAHLNCS